MTRLRDKGKKTTMAETDILLILWKGLLWPLARLLFFISIGLLVANFIEALNWTNAMARLAAPLIRFGRFSNISEASFTMALISGVSANTMLSEAYQQKKIDKQELILANLLNSLPHFFLHLPTVFFLTAPLIKGAAFIYVGLTMTAAILRTTTVMVVGRFLLKHPAADEIGAPTAKEKGKDWRQAWEKTRKRFRKRIRKIVLFTVPVYTIIFLLHRGGVFNDLEAWISKQTFLFTWLDPQSISIVVLHVAAEFTAGLAAAGALIDAGSLDYRQVVLALLVGNVLSSPIRAVRHQLPYYAGIFPPKVAAELIFYSQAFRIGSVILVGIGYFWATV